MAKVVGGLTGMVEGFLLQMLDDWKRQGDNIVSRLNKRVAVMGKFDRYTDDG